MVVYLKGSSLHSLDVQYETIGSLKSFVRNAEGIAEDEQAFYYAGTPLNDEQTIAECVPAGGTIEVLAKLRGGKVHGSLARAGKVKGQTPKVEKQEKKKKKTGRAKRRMQFNRRFVNVVVTFGRKKGPNSNS